MIIMPLRNPALHLSSVELLGFSNTLSSGRRPRSGASKVGISISGLSAPFSEPVGVATTFGTSEFFSINPSAGTNGPYTLTIFDPSGNAKFSALPNNINDLAITGSGTSNMVITGDATNINALMQTAFAITSSAPGSEVISFSVTAPGGATASKPLQVSAQTTCFVSGTHIATPGGAVAVENLTAGDQVITATGQIRPIRWVGHTTMDCGDLREPSACYPVRIRTGAFGRHLPQRDLLLSPGHHVFVDGVLVPASALVNGITIVREPVGRVTYWHVELDSHDVILAEGLPSETYLDTGNRATFARQAAVVVPLRAASVDPDAVSKVWATEACAPRIDGGQRMDHLRWRLLEEARNLNIETTADPAVRLFADEKPITGEWRDGWLHVNIPADAQTLRLASRSAAAAWANPASNDFRNLGVCILEALADGVPLALDGPALVSGFSHLETDGARSWRWTDGDATLQVTGVRTLSMRIPPIHAYAVEPAGAADTTEVEQAA